MDIGFLRKNLEHIYISPPQARLKMVHTVEINADPYRHSMTPEASTAKSIKKNRDKSKSKSKRTCCKVIVVIIGVTFTAVVIAFSICHHKLSLLKVNHNCKFRKIHKCT